MRIAMAGRTRPIRPRHGGNSSACRPGADGAGWQNLKLKRRSLAKEGQESRRQRQQRRPTGESKEERQPPIDRQLRGLREPQLAHARFADGNAKLEQFAVNPRCAPERVVAAHRTNQGSDVRRDCRSPRPPPPNLPRLEESEALAMPPDHRRRFHNGGTRLPILPDRRQPSPQEWISGGQIRPLHRPLQNTELMTKGHNLILKRRATAKESQESRRQRHQRRRTRESKEGRQP